MSNVKTAVTLTNVSLSPCALPNGTVTVGGVSADGAVVPFDESPGTYFGDPIPSDRPIAPGDHAVVWIVSGSPGACAPDGGADRWDELELGVPGVGRIRVSVPPVFTGGPYGSCNVTVSALGVDP
ncbi:MAG: hypothetical protein ICV72_10800 [Aldersonia sp.]|nr:hypothetical protein [Aldersonia sp.]